MSPQAQVIVRRVPHLLPPNQNEKVNMGQAGARGQWDGMGRVNDRGKLGRGKRGVNGGRRGTGDGAKHVMG